MVYLRISFSFAGRLCEGLSYNGHFDEEAICLQNHSQESNAEDSYAKGKNCFDMLYNSRMGFGQEISKTCPCLQRKALLKVRSSRKILIMNTEGLSIQNEQCFVGTFLVSPKQIYCYWKKFELLIVSSVLST